MAFAFEWDARKARLNLVKHNVSFDEATTVFDDPWARIFDDEFHSGQEKREIIVGRSINGGLLVVCFTERASETIRIIGARAGTPRERRKYEENVES